MNRIFTASTYMYPTSCKNAIQWRDIRRNTFFGELRGDGLVRVPASYVYIDTEA